MQNCKSGAHRILHSRRIRGIRDGGGWEEENFLNKRHHVDVWTFFQRKQIRSSNSFSSFSCIVFKSNNNIHS